MNQVSIAATQADEVGATRRQRLRPSRMLTGAFVYLAAVLAISAATVFSAEAVLRGSFGEALAFLLDLKRPGPATVAILALTLIGLDALMKRAMQSALIVVPLVLMLAWIGHEKRFYLGDPPYPTDFLYARQIVELLPLMLAERLADAAVIAALAIAAMTLLALLWRWSARLPRTAFAGRAARLAFVMPALVYFASQMDYASHSNIRARLKITPKMWDQTANYRHNGLVMAFALNVPMAYVAPPPAYSASTIETATRLPATLYAPAARPDIIIVMSESLWDPTRLPGVTITPDPLAFTKSIQSGHIFSPEFGGMTSNVEFEALTGFSNALLPYGSIPYQQYVRGEIPSVASFLKQQGYATLAVHPFQSWFWNRGPVYRAFGFDRFLSEENMPKLEKRGGLASDAALTELIIEEVEASAGPMFLFAVTLQNHGPYAAGRYSDQRIEVETKAGGTAPAAIHSFSEGMVDSDLALKRLIDWAETRQRETIVVFFGDHLPPLGSTYVATGFMDGNVGNRFAAPDRMIEQRETPLVVWSSRRGVVSGIGTVSPAFLPVHVLGAAGMKHPYYTGFLGELHEAYRVVDRHLLIGRDGDTAEGWARQQLTDPLLRDYRLIQYDILFGQRYGADRLFPTSPEPLLARPHDHPNAAAPL